MPGSLAMRNLFAGMVSSGWVWNGYPASCVLHVGESPSCLNGPRWTPNFSMAAHKRISSNCPDARLHAEQTEELHKT